MIRIVSQENQKLGFKDVPYDSTSFVLDLFEGGCDIEAIIPGRNLIMARYSSEEIARKAMCILDNAIAEIFEQSLDDGFIALSFLKEDEIEAAYDLSIRKREEKIKRLKEILNNER